MLRLVVSNPHIQRPAPFPMDEEIVLIDCPRIRQIKVRDLLPQGKSEVDTVDNCETKTDVTEKLTDEGETSMLGLKIALYTIGAVMAMMAVAGLVGAAAG